MRSLSKFFSFLLLIAPFFLFGNEYNFTILENSSNKIRISITFEQPQIVTDNGMQVARYNHSQLVLADDNVIIPRIVKFFNLPVEFDLIPKIVSIKQNQLKVNKYHSIETSNVKPHSITSAVSSQYLGKQRSLPVHVLHIYPVKYDKSTSILTWTESLEIELAIPKSKTGTPNVSKVNIAKNNLVSSLFINDKTEIYTSENIAGVAKASKSEIGINPILNKENIFKIAVNQTGLYQVTYNDLLDTDYPVDYVNPQRLSLYLRGTEVPIYFKGAEDGHFDENDYFEFWGLKNEKTFLDQFPDQYNDPFSDENIYWLVENSTNGRRLVEENGALIQSGSGNPILEPFAFTEKLHFEEDRHVEKFGKNGSHVDKPTYYLDQWYFDSGIRAPEGGAYNFYLPSPYEYGNNVIVTAAFRGKSYYEYNVNMLEGHKVDLKLRGKDDIAKRVGIVNPEDKWRDQSMKIITNADSSLKLSQSMLNDGMNSLEVDMFQTGVSDAVLLNWFEINYLRKYIAYQNHLKFSVDDNFFNNQYVNLGDPIRFNIDGFGSNQIDLYKIGVSKIINSQIKMIEEGTNTTYRMTFQDEVFDTEVEYIAIAKEAKLKPLSIIAYKPWIVDGSDANLINENNRAEYLIITDNLLYTTSQRLLDLKEQDGYSTEIVTVENIYDTFNYGVKSPIAIKQFIEYAVNYWDNAYPLKYIVFVGDASYDYKGNRGTKTDIVPTFMYQTVDFGATGSDYWYALLDDDYIPDISVARIPAQSNQQLSNYIDKIENYGQNNDLTQWRNRALFISGNDASGGDRELLTNQPIFRAQNLRLADMQLPSNIFASRLNTIQDEAKGMNDPDFGSTTDLIEYFDDGVSFINFLGHGGGSIWADVNLLNLDDIDRLNNGSRLPFIASMTCFTGAFENPGNSGLAEKLILSEDKGAIAMLASSGFGWKYNDMAIEWGLFEFLWDDLTFGQAVDLMKIYYLANPIYYTENGSFYTLSYSMLNKTMVSQYNLLGDPALKLQRPTNNLQLTINDSNPFPGDSVELHIEGGISTGNGRLEIVDRKNLLIFSSTFVHQSTGVDIGFRISDTLEADILTAKVYVSNGVEDANGSIEFGLARSIIKNIVFTPLQPKVNESISFEIEIVSGTSVESVKLYNFRDFDNLGNYNFNITTQKMSETLFQSNVDLPGFSTSGLKYFDVLVRDSAGVEEIYRWRKLTISDDRPDVRILTNTLAYTGTDQLQIKFDVHNDSQTDLSDIAIACFTDKGINDNIPFSESTVSLKSGEQKNISVNFNSTSYKDTRNFKIELDPQNHFAERNEDNNILQKQLDTDHILIQPNVGTSINGLDNDTLVLAEKWKFFVPKDTITQSVVVKFSEVEFLNPGEKIEQEELTPIRLTEQDLYLAAEITLGNLNENLNFKAFLSTGIETTPDSLNQLSYYYYDKFLDLWVQSESDLDGSNLEAIITRSGLYAIFYNSDDKEPFIEISSNGRPLVQDFLVVRKPVISILLQDESGINLNNSFTLLLDDQVLVSNGVPVNMDAVNYPDSLENSKTISILATPELETGEHTLHVSIADVNGNFSEEQVLFKVSATFDITVFGNYPNPFEDQTVISYYINNDSDLDKFSIKIFTTSGRLIRSDNLGYDESLSTVSPEWDREKAVGYHELIWNGDDDDGNQVANGVYFAVIKGTYQGKTVTHTLKIARLQ